MHQLDTPEHVSLSYEVADIGSRFLAALIDTLIMTLSFVLIALTVAAAFTALMVTETIGFGDYLDDSLVLWLLVLWQVFSFLLLWGYYVFFEMILNGQSPGKRVLKLRVIRQDGYPIGLSNSVVRNIVRIVDFLPAYYLLGVIVMLLNSRARRLGDLAAGTIVVKERLDYSASALQVDFALQDGDRVPNIERLDQADYRLVKEYFLRRDSLPMARSDALARRIAEGIAAKLGIDYGLEQPERFLSRVGGAYERHHGRGS